MDGIMTVKEYAASRGKSAQAVYKQIRSKQNAAALEGHILTCKVGNKDTKALDDVAVSVLDQASKQSIQVVLQASDKEQITQLEKENRALLEKIILLQDLIREKDQKLLEAEETAVMLEKKKRDADFFQDKFMAEHIRWQEAERKSQQLSEELEEERSKSWWAKLWGR